MKKINIQISFYFILFITVFSCNINTDETNKESVAIITLLYNNQLLYFHSPPPPPPPKDLPLDEIKPVENTEIIKYDSDKIILEGKFAIVMDNENDLKKSDLKKFPTEFKEIYLNPYHLISVDQLRKIDLRDSSNKKIPIVNKQGIKIQDLAEENKVLGILFVSEIKFNKEFNKAILIFASYTHELAGNTSVIGLKKIKGKWKIKHGQILSES